MALLAVIVIGVLLARRCACRRRPGGRLRRRAARLRRFSAVLSRDRRDDRGRGLGAGALLWLEWHRRIDLRAALAGAVATSVLLGGVVSAAATYASYWGPTHPRSAAAADMGVVEWMWSGGVTPTGAAVRLRTAADADMVRLLVSESETCPPVAVAEARPDGDRVADLHVGGSGRTRGTSTRPRSTVK